MDIAGTERLQILANLLVGLPEFMSRSGLDHGAVAQAVGLDPQWLVEEDRYLDLDRFAELLETAAILSGDDTFGLRFAQWQFDTQETAGALTLAMRNAASVREALLTLIRYVHTRMDIARFELIVEGTRATVEWAFSPLIIQRWQLCDYAAAVFLARAASLVPNQWRPRAIGLERPPPKAVEMHRRVFGRRVEFSRPINSVTFPAGLLQQPIRDANPALHKMATQLLDRIAAERQVASDLLTSVREAIVWGLRQEEGVQLPRIARRLGVSPRSLQRRLAEEGTTFQALLDETRKLLAERHFDDPHISFSQIAYRLGFSAPSAFTRACYRWFGMRPGEARRMRGRARPARGRTTRKAPPASQ